MIRHEIKRYPRKWDSCVCVCVCACVCMRACLFVDMDCSDSYSELLDVSYKLIASLLTQTDLSKRRVSESEAKVWAETRGFRYFETSAQSGQGISEMFNVSTYDIVQCKSSIHV